MEDGHIKVVVRCRPFNDKEKIAGAQSVVDMVQIGNIGQASR